MKKHVFLSVNVLTDPFLDNSALSINAGEKFYELTNAAFLLISAIISHFPSDHIILIQKVIILND
jgi:hypothetical protein